METFADTSSIAGLAGTDMWSGGVLSPSGLIFGIPSGSASVLIIDPVSKIADTSSIAGLTGSAKWFGGVLSPSGKIFGMPFNSDSVLEVDCGVACGEGIPSEQQWMLSAFVNKI